MSKPNSNQEKWLKSGYFMFGQSGPDALKVERLSMLVGLNRSSFYHYYGDVFMFEAKLLEYHLECYKKISLELDKCTDFETGVVHLCNVYKENLGFQRQLLINEAIPRYKECMLKARAFTQQKVYQLWSEYELTTGMNEIDKSLYEVVMDYCLIHFEQGRDEEVNNIMANIKTFVHSSTDKIS